MFRRMAFSYFPPTIPTLDIAVHPPFISFRFWHQLVYISTTATYLYNNTKWRTYSRHPPGTKPSSMWKLRIWFPLSTAAALHALHLSHGRQSRRFLLNQTAAVQRIFEWCKSLSTTHTANTILYLDWKNGVDCQNYPRRIKHQHIKHPIWSRWTKVQRRLLLEFDARSLISRLIPIAGP